MIALVEGEFIEKEPTHVVVLTPGIGYHLNISLHTYARIKDRNEGRLYTYLHVKEDSQTLFGFFNQEERKIFLHLLSISGVGPSIALTIQSSLTPEELFNAIVYENADVIQRVKGVGGKTAQRVVLELKDKLRKEGLIEKSKQSEASTSNTLRQEALSALTTLGINKAAAEKSITEILNKYGDDITLEELIKLALKTT